MKISNIPFSETQAFPKMILDYLSANENLQPFYQYAPLADNIPQVIENKRMEIINRPVLVKTINEQYAGIDRTELVSSNINDLLNENSFCITTAHQLNIFTGPLYYIYKIACAINMCRSLKTKYPQYNFVPVYWMGSEDHDFEEINHIHVFNKTFTWDDKQGGPTGHYSTSSLLPLIAELRAALSNLPFADEWINLLHEAYNHKDLTDAARYLVNALFGEYGLVIIDGNCNNLKNEFRPVMEDELLNQASYRLVNEQVEKLASFGYKEQAYPREINLFYMSGQLRERIVFDNFKYKVQNTTIEFTREEILEELKSFPEKFSPNVILRPLFQQKILPSLAYVGGGGELSYWLQLKPVFEHYHINFPQLILRNSAIYLNKNQQEKIQKLGFTPADLFRETEVLKKEFVLRNTENEIDLEPERKNIIQQFEQIKDKAVGIDTTLVNAIGAEQQKTLQGIENMEKRLLRSLKQKSETELNQLDKLKQQLFPENTLQERFDNISTIYAANGPSFIKMLIGELDPYQKEFLAIEE